MAAYDVSVLAAKLKAHGLDIAEEAVRDVVEDVFSWVEDSVKESTTPYDDILLGILPVVKSEVLKRVDTIDGHVGA